MKKTRRREKPKTAEEFVRELNADPAYVERRRRLDEELRVANEQHSRAEAPLVRALNEAGYQWVRSVWDLVNTADPYPKAIAVLLEHLERPYPEKVLEGIARALAVPEARPGWLTLSQLFRLNSDEKTNGVKWALGCALAGAADDTVTDDVIALVEDRAHGENRVALLSALARSNNVRAHAALEAALADPQLAREAQGLLRKRRRR